jgi:palmitoyl-[glycerolipid] 3-(E)-desaturase
MVLNNNLIRHQKAQLSSTRMWRIVSCRMILIVLLVLLVVSMKSSFAYVPSHHHTRIISSSSNTILPSCMTFPYHHSPQHRMRMTTTTTTTTAPEEQQQQQQQQQLDEEYFNALQNFAASATTTTTTTSDSNINENDDINTADTTTTITTKTVSSSSSASSSSAASSSSWRDDGFVFGLNDELQRPVGKQALIVVEGDSMETQPYQVALVSITLLNHMYYILTSIIELYHINNNNNTNTILLPLFMTVLQILGVSLFSWISADLGSGILHWSVDNYGNGRTPIMGNIIAAFQGHHTAPWTITQRSFYNNVYKLCIPFGILPVTIMAYLTGPILTYFFTTFCILEILSQEFHKWSHQMKSETPWIGNLLQKYHLSIGRVPHTKHHTIPFETNYCIISGICNPILDQYGFFRRLEHYIYQYNGIESNAWKLDPILRQRTMNGIYTPPDTI